MSDFVVVHSTLSGNGNEDESKSKITAMVEKAIVAASAKREKLIAFVSSENDIRDEITKMIESCTPRIALSGGDGFQALFLNHFFRLKESMQKQSYDPDILFLAGGTGNAMSYCTRFKNPFIALKCFYAEKYETMRLNLLEVTTDKRKELTQFVSFGADGEILSIYDSQKLKGLPGYIWAVLKYSFSRKLYNPFSRNDANYNLDVEIDGERVHSGRHEGGGVSVIPYVGHGFRPYPLAVDGFAHLRFVLFGALLMPTMFKLTKWNFLKWPNRIIYDNQLTSPAVMDFKFDRELHVQISGDCVEKQSGVRVEYSKAQSLNLVKSTRS